MGAVTLKEDEGAPAAWPAVTHWNRPDPLPDDPTVDPATTWARIEAWIARRWPARSVVWIVEGPGEWTPRLTPFTASTVERWTGSAWETAAADPSPLGGYQLDGGTYRIAGTAGDDATPPEAVLEAHRRLHEFHVGIAWNWRAETAAYRSQERQAPSHWAAKAMHLSGAADLLRPWRALR